jgi:ribosomal protein L31
VIWPRGSGNSEQCVKSHTAYTGRTHTVHMGGGKGLEGFAA